MGRTHVVNSHLRQRFRSEETAKAFSEAYATELARWPVPVTPTDVSGRFGTTHVQICGDPDWPPLVLLHGHGATSTVWFANIADLAKAHRVYAVDQLGDAGMSVPADMPIRGSDGYMVWLDELVDHFQLKSAAFCGHSYGAWLALTYALHAPTRVAKLALLDPTDCFAGLNLGYRLRAVPLFVRSSAERARRVVTWESHDIALDQTSLTLACLGGGEYRASKLVVPHRPRPEDLRSLEAETLVVLAQKSRAHDIHEVRDAAERHVPGVSVVVLPGASHHSLPATDPEALNRELLRFLV
jgi:pimeloyl-ACP methyl ester carboxylesterase